MKQLDNRMDVAEQLIKALREDLTWRLDQLPMKENSSKDEEDVKQGARLPQQHAVHVF
ncbi:hypothetical protein TRIUR3_13353 [Triticum urartu]|uniref:Uncharacterized protein n=1 Tax=Triticum urartu TaxID=4572 RepID=M7YIP1_TRIUA|nr:hypothetical protein TRIUR3_13353 [Triticum urartu]